MTDMTELFNRDPLSLTREDIDAVIAKMREQRHLFNSRPTSAKPKKLTAAQSKLANLKLDDDDGLSL